MSLAPTMPVESTSPIAKQPRVLVSVATYNELENLPLLVDEMFAVAPQVEILVIDDNSPDGTGVWAKERTRADVRVHVLHRAGQVGARHSDHRGDEICNRARLRLLAEPRRRFQPSSALHSRPARGHGTMPM